MGGEKIPTKLGKVVFFPHEIMAAAREAEISIKELRWDFKRC